MKSITVDSQWDGRRLTRFLQKAMPSASVGHIRKFLRLGRIRVNGKRAGEDAVLAEGAVVEMYVEDEFFAEVEREDPFYSRIRPKLTILYEDEHVMLLDKRVGLICHPDEGDAATHELPVLDAALSDHLAVILSGEQWVDVMKPGVHKGRAMQMLQEIKGVSPEQCMAFGDYLNDVQLLESVAESYAMENALPEIKEIARYIAPSNEECGVVRVIKERFSL